MTGGWNAARGPADQRDHGRDVRWDLKAACAKVDLFMVDVSRLDDAEKAETRRICRTCPVRIECLTDALEKEKAGIQVWGIRGGKTHAQRTGKAERQDRADEKTAKRWTEEEDALVRANALEPIVQQSTLGRSSAALFAQSLGRSVDAVRCRRNVLRRRDEKEARA